MHKISTRMVCVNGKNPSCTNRTTLLHLSGSKSPNDMPDVRRMCDAYKLYPLKRPPTGYPSGACQLSAELLYFTYLLLLEETKKPVVEYGTARYDFTASASDELSFKKGDRIEVTEIVSDDWLRGRLGDHEGMFPQAFVQLSNEPGTASNHLIYCHALEWQFYVFYFI